MDRLDIPKVGDPIAAKWAQAVVDTIRRQEVIPGNGLRKTVTDKGTTLNMNRTKNKNIIAQINMFPNASFLAKIVGGDAQTFFEINLYPNGMNGKPYQNSSGNTVTFYAQACDMVAQGSNLIGRWCIVHFIPCAVIAGEDF